MTTTAYIILKYESVIRKPIMANHTFFAFVVLQDHLLRLYELYRLAAFVVFNLQKNFHQDNLPFVCFQFYKDNCLNILVGNICFLIQVKNQ